ncbi:MULTISPECIES: hydrogenase formation protein HypD [Enterobacteriaceae]|uniref:hydrogenase formation protein HypD n=1 Tax=Enterobacteriaceae TaxID=543 RepID=UPI00024F1E6C|nr:MULTISPECIES: hydrogenase formation protein HypD [Enterobacteriaceae]EFC6552370.1 hydrogenase formation protein HypD [Escherichia coli]EBB7791852.1 hydrogenase formation protein HypD [Salmonella enterica subsp. enterica serovar Senftenberg]EBF7042219.1 hydrogenase formation protein HypD [Salmonella enterica subsp. enterica serovar Senftenberg]EFL7416976.1 hydrogenase formation protein HypD [Escherichia coli]EFN4126697.1 hydrogenase formation protein HypD [Escherichia coli]
MRFVDEYREPKQVMQLIAHLHELAVHLVYTPVHPLRIMEVCGGHTHSIYKFGLDQLLPNNIEFIHGPGCPVCVLPMGRIDTCVEIASRPEVIFCTFGDAIRVPGKNGSLLQAKARGADVRIVYSPMDALALAEKNPQRKVVFFGLGFETTMPATAITLQQAKARNISNFWFFCQHITLIPTLRSLLKQPDNGIDAFLAPGHVSMVIGTDAYTFIAEEFRCPLVVAGFEPLDLLQGVVMLVEQKITAQNRVENQYRRVVPDEGNHLAQAVIADVFAVSGDSEWRGLGMIGGSRVHLTLAYQQFDAEAHFRPVVQQVYDDPRARCGDVLTGRCKPHQCKLFGNICNPQSAFGALMVSSEGACAAWYQFRTQECEV